MSWRNIQGDMGHSGCGGTYEDMEDMGRCEDMRDIGRTGLGDMWGHG